VTGSRLVLLRELVRRDLEARWRGSFLGILWAIGQPLGWLALYLVIFGAVLRVPAPVGAERHGFGLFLLSGLLPFLAIQEGISRGASTWLESATLIKKTRVPPSVFVWTACLSALVLEIVALVLLAIYEVATGRLATERLGWVALGLVGQLLVTLIPAFVAAILAAFLRDLILALPFLLSALFYLTPIVYPRELAPIFLRSIIDANPMAWVLQFFRAAFAGGAPPDLATTLVVLPILLLAVHLLGRTADRLRPHLADIL
jgi:ABC-type polysaccharide/polyol phosphate export permease